MKTPEILETLKAQGKPQTAAIYKHYDCGDDVYGVLTSEIAKLAKKLKTNQALALDLWQTGNAEARILALLIADPAQVTRALAERLIAEGEIRFLWCYLTGLVARSPVAEETMRAWMKSPEEFPRQIGFSLLSLRVKDDPNSVSDAEASAALETIEREIHGCPNWARYGMNGALIAIGIFKPTLTSKALQAAERIGKVDVDHGETGCKTPGAVAYITKASKRKHCP